MKKLLTGILLVLVCQSLWAQRIKNAEYFIDTNDPGSGHGTPIALTIGDSINTTVSVPVGSLLPGFHKVFLRVQDSLNRWSFYESRNFYVQAPVTIPAATQLHMAEYFFDVDPGQGHGTSISLTQADSVSQFSVLSAAALNPGFHKLFIRSQNSNGSWSLYEGRNFYVQAPVILPATIPLTLAEYFFDADPGVGKGTPIATSPGDSLNMTQIISAAALPAGFHKIFVRTANSNNVWSLYEGRNFYIQPTVVIPVAPQIQAAEYFFDIDPGQGHGTSFSVTTSDSISLTQTIALSSVSTGFHKLFIRTQNTNGAWSLYEGRNFYKAPALPVLKTSPKIIAAEYYIDTDPGEGKGTAVSNVIPGDSINMTNLSLSVSSLTNGTHNVFMRVKDSLGVWSLYEGRTFKIKTCSITASATATNTSCFGGNNGTARAIPGGGTAPYTYSWSTVPVQTKDTAVNLLAGSYTVTVTDSSGCPATAVVSVGHPAAIAVTATVVGTTCNQANGQALVSASGGTGAFLYSWSTTPSQSTVSVGGLPAGAIYVKVTDANGCYRIDTAQIAASSAPALTVSTIPSNCGVAIGSATVTATGGNAPYRYNWSNGSTTVKADSLRSGIYIVTVTDKNGCATFAPATITDANGPTVGANVTQVSCFGQVSGAISVAVIGGTAPYTFLWSNGAITSALSNLPAGPYQVTINDAAGCKAVQTITVTEPPAITLNLTSTNSVCLGSSGSVTAVANGGTLPYTYSWNNGGTSSTVNVLPAAVYALKLTDNNGCVDTGRVAVSNINGPLVNIATINNANCSSALGGSVTVSVTGGLTPYAYSWSNGSTVANIGGLSAGTYDIRVTDNGGCKGTASAVILETPPPVVPICIVTVDNTSQFNQIVWEKTPGLRKIKSYKIYKESTSAGVYFLAGTRPYDSLSVFIDQLSNPNVRSWRYKISQVDSCGSESMLSLPHKTMHVTLNQGLANAVNLIWDNYEGLTFGSYYLYRDTTLATFTKIDSFPNNLFTYTDPSPPQGHPLFYRIGIVDPTGCNPSGKSINYNGSKSNTGNRTAIGTGIELLAGEFNSVVIYPNPGVGVFNLNLSLVKDKQHVTVMVYDMMGQRLMVNQYTTVSGSIRKQIDLAGYPAGVYFVRIQGDQDMITRRIIIN
jgi:hypothetical protein